MSTPIGERYRVTLLLGAWRRGFLPFLRQFRLIVKDTLLCRKELIFRLDTREASLEEVNMPAGLVFREVTNWDHLPESFRNQESDTFGHSRWVSKEYLSRGWRLWVGMEGEEVAAAGWWCDSEKASKAFFPIPEGAELLVLAVVFPKYRGRRLQFLLRHTLIQDRVRSGVRVFYVHCADYNTPSLQTIRNLGFKEAGYGVEWRVTGRRIWHLDDLDDETRVA